MISEIEPKAKGLCVIAALIFCGGCRPATEEPVALYEQNTETAVAEEPKAPIAQDEMAVLTGDCLASAFTGGEGTAVEGRRRQEQG